jgi:hypothetical protein
LLFSSVFIILPRNLSQRFFVCMQNTSDSEDSPSYLSACFAAIFPAYRTTPVYAADEPRTHQHDDTAPRLSSTYTSMFPELPSYAGIGKWLHEHGNIYPLYGVLDGLVLAYSMLRYVFDLFHTTEPSSISVHALHEWMATPLGFIEALAWSLALIICAAVSNTDSASNDPDRLARYQKWKLFRDALKALRNTFRGLLSILKAFELLTSMSVRYMLLPGGLILGIIAMIVRVWYRSMGDDRQQEQDRQKDLISDMETWGSLIELSTLAELETTSQPNLITYKNTFILITKDVTPENNGLHFIDHRGERTQVCTSQGLPHLKSNLVPEDVHTLGKLPSAHDLRAQSLEYNNSYLIIQSGDQKSLNDGLHFIDEQGTREHLYASEDIPSFFTNRTRPRSNSYTQDGTYKFLKGKKGEPFKIRPDILQWRALFSDNPHALKTLDNLYIKFLENTRTQGTEKYQPSESNTLKNLAAAFGGLANGVYLFMGLISLVPLSTPILFILTGFSVFASLACILTNLHEEHDYQNLHVMSTQKVEIALAAKELELKLAEYNKIFFSSCTPEAGHVESASILADEKNQASIALDRAHQKLMDAHDELFKTSLVSIDDAYLIGLRHGLAACSSIICGVFASSVLSYLLLGAALPQLFILASVILAVYILTVSVEDEVNRYENDNELRRAHFHDQNNELAYFITENKDKPLTSLFREFKARNIADLTQGVTPRNHPRLTKLEHLRQWFSGIMKGPKYLDLLLTAFEEPGHHEHEAAWLPILALPFAALFSFAWSGRGLAKDHHKLFDNTPDYPADYPDDYPDELDDGSANIRPYSPIKGTPRRGAPLSTSGSNLRSTPSRSSLTGVQSPLRQFGGANVDTQTITPVPINRVPDSTLSNYTS